ncbi:MAG: long-chain fatty acid--CoA ligase [Desulfobacterales bacterium]|nr:long-chain fatty acid--CoA ligase [Desulfobacterales bacterium]
MNIAWWVKRWSELNPEKTAVFFEGERISYLELSKRVDQAGCWLQSVGIEKGDRVAVLLPNRPEFIELYLACSRLGAIFSPINFRLTAPELEYILGNLKPGLLVFDHEYSETVSSIDPDKGRPVLSLARVGQGSSSREIPDYRTASNAFEGKTPFLTKTMAPANPEEPHVIMYTSGVTGEPKGAVLSHRKTFFNCLNAEIFFKLHFDDIMLIVLPLFHSGGLFIQASPILFKGAAMVLHRGFDPRKAFEDIRKHQVTKFLGVPTIYKALVRVKTEKSLSCSSLKVCAIGGEKLTPELLTRLHEAGFKTRQIMGQTETSILLWASEEDVIENPGSVGKPVFHAEVRIVDQRGRPCKTGEVGEIVVRGSIMMTEYWRDPEKTRETIRGGWLYTGDLARVDEDGRFYLVDRAKDMYISGGENVYPAEVERVLRRHPGIEDAAIVGTPDAEWGEVGRAFVAPKPGVDLDVEEVLDFCRGRLARYKWPRKVHFMKELPRTALGKVRKTALKESDLK